MKEKNYKFNNRKLTLSNLGKIFFPVPNYSKQKVLDYYRNISPVMLPHLAHRPLNMQRAPDGLDGDIFYQQAAPDYFPDWIDTITLSRADGSPIRHALCNSSAALLYLANQAVLSFHTWLSKTPDLGYPDKLIFDLDPPPGHNFDLVVQAAVNIKNFLDRISVRCGVMTTGSSGLHLVIPLLPRFSFDQVRDTARKIASCFARKSPLQYTLETLKEKRKGRLYLDYTRNAYGQTTICPYSIRTLPRAPIAVPLDWHELHKPGMDSQKYNLSNISRRLGQKEDPWKHFYKPGEDLMEINKKISVF